MKITRVIVILICMQTVPYQLLAQNTDLGLWNTLTVRHDFQMVTASLIFGYRIQDHVRMSSLKYASFQGAHSFNDFLSIDASYIYGNSRLKNASGASHWTPIHCWYISMIGICPLGNMNISLRERLQYLFYPEEKGRNRFYYRTQIKAQYPIRYIPVSPYFSYELYHTEQIQLSRYRITGGCQFRISEAHICELYYRYQKNVTESMNAINVLGIGYTIKI